MRAFAAALAVVVGKASGRGVLHKPGLWRLQASHRDAQGPQ